MQLDSKGYLIYSLIQQKNNYLVINNSGSHATIYTNDFMFSNSDGSTNFSDYGLNFMEINNANMLIEYLICMAKLLIICQYH